MRLSGWAATTPADDLAHHQADRAGSGDAARPALPRCAATRDTGGSVGAAGVLRTTSTTHGLLLLEQKFDDFRKVGDEHTHPHGHAEPGTPRSRTGEPRTGNDTSGGSPSGGAAAARLRSGGAPRAGPQPAGTNDRADSAHLAGFAHPAGAAPVPCGAASAGRRHRRWAPRRAALTEGPNQQIVGPGMSCCGAQWVGADRAHCCRRTGGCGHVFDDAQLWDAHRVQGKCLDPRSRGMVHTTDGIWLRTLDLVPRRSSPAAGQRRASVAPGVRSPGSPARPARPASHPAPPHPPGGGQVEGADVRVGGSDVAVVAAEHP